jgi:hypothetical protein
MSMDELANVKGRGWEDIDVRGMTFFLFARCEGILTPLAALIMRVSDMAEGHLKPFLHAGTVRLDLQLDACDNQFGRFIPDQRSGMAIPRCQIRVRCRRKH